MWRQHGESGNQNEAAIMKNARKAKMKIMKMASANNMENVGGEVK
jgi:hypothetical protein